MSAPLVSVIMPMHNAAPFVGDAVRSVLAQTEKSWELIVVDDASTDGSGEIVRAFDDARVRLFRNEECLNAAGARNRGLAEARGEFIAFLDADDIAMPERIASQLAMLGDKAVGIVASPVLLIDQHGEKCGTNFAARSAQEIGAVLLWENCIALSSVTARRDVLQAFDPAFAPAEDYHLWARLADSVSFAMCAEALTQYRVHSSGVSARQPAEMDAAVASIHAMQLARLGIEPGGSLHAMLARWPLQPSMQQLIDAEAWLRRLVKANDERVVYPTENFRRAIVGKWFDLCMDSWSLGWPVWQIYRSSVLADGGLKQRARLWRRLLPQLLRKA